MPATFGMAAASQQRFRTPMMWSQRRPLASVPSDRISRFDPAPFLCTPPPQTSFAPPVRNWRCGRPHRAAAQQQGCWGAEVGRWSQQQRVCREGGAPCVRTSSCAISWTAGSRGSPVGHRHNIGINHPSGQSDMRCS